MTKVITRREGTLWYVAINRPNVKNAIDKETAQLLYHAFSQFEADTELSVAILHGIGDTFCSGADLKSIAYASSNAPELSEEGNGPLGPTRMNLKKPVIAAIEGYAVAGGRELALWCDLRVISETTVFGVFCRRFGVPLVDGGTIRLPRLIGQSRAMDMVLTGRPVDAAEAYSIGLANRLVPSGTSLEHATQLAQKLSLLPQFCMRSDRLSLIEQWDLNLDEALQNEAVRGIDVVDSGETVTGAAKFFDSQ